MYAMQRSVTSWPYKTLANVTRQIPRIMARLSPPGVQSPALKKSLFEGSFQGRQRAITSLARSRKEKGHNVLLLFFASSVSGYERQQLEPLSGSFSSQKKSFERSAIAHFSLGRK